MTFFDDKASAINDLIAAVEAIENELGPLPAGVYASVRTRLDILESRINSPLVPSPNVTNPFFIGGSPISGVSIQDGYGDPNTTYVQGIPGSLYLREDGYNIQGLYSFRTDGYWHQVNTDPSGINRLIGSTVVFSSPGVGQVATPYTIRTIPDDFIPVDSSGGIITINLPALPLSGKGYTIADITGHAAANNITINGNGFLINGASTFVLNTNYQKLSVVFNGLNWTIL